MHSKLITFSRKDLLNALCIASTKGHINKVKRLLTIPFIRENITYCQNMAFRLAAENGHLDIVKLLLSIPEVRAQAAASDNHALRYAAENGHLKIVKILLMIPIVRENAAMNANHALRWSAANGHLDIVNCLLEIDPVSNNVTANNNQALRFAIDHEHFRVAARLLRVPAVLQYMKEHQPTFISDNKAAFDQILKNSIARAILPRILAEQTLTAHKIPFDIIVAILEKHSHSDICGKSQCKKSTSADEQPYCSLIHNFARRTTKRKEIQDNGKPAQDAQPELACNVNKSYYA